MKEENKIFPENIIKIKDEYYYCINDIIYKGEKCEIYRGKESSNDIIGLNNSLSSSLSICVKSEPPFLKYPELSKEYLILNSLQKYLDKDINGNIPCPFIPKIYNFYQNNDSPSFLIEQLLGSSIDTIFKMCHRKFSIMSTLIIIKQMLEITSAVPHSRGKCTVYRCYLHTLTEEVRAVLQHFRKGDIEHEMLSKSGQMESCFHCIILPFIVLT